MEVSTVTISACIAKSLIVRQLHNNSFCVTGSNFTENDEFVAVEDSIDVGNVLYILYDYLYDECNMNSSKKKRI